MSAPPSTQMQMQSQAGPGVPLKRGLDFSSLWTLYVLTLRQYQHGKRWIVLALLMLLPVGLAILVRSTAHDVPAIGVEFILVFMFIPQAILPLIALIYASGIIQDEQEEQTISYLLVRPIPKWALYGAKLLATLTTTVGLTVLFMVLTYVAIYAGVRPSADSHVDSAFGYAASRCLKAACIHSLAVITYCCLFGMMSLVTKRILVAGILYIAVIEGLFANLAFGIRLITVIYYTRIMAYRSMEFLVPVPGSVQNFAADAWQLDVQNDPNLLEHPQIRTCLTVLIVGSLVCTALAMWLCSRREFHVKTPEKG